MKQQLSIVAECGAVAIIDAAQSPSHRYPVPPFASFFETVWHIIKKDYSQVYEDPESEITMYYNGMLYRWDDAAIRRCFEQHEVEEKELADILLIVAPVNEL